MTEITPIFLLSLPRSGSTLLQRMLAKNKEVTTTAEPWILLEHFNFLRSGGFVADYDSEFAEIAVNEFINNLPNKRLDYISALRKFAENLYSSIAIDGEKYFLDKTPRYSLISNQLHEVFPGAKYIYLWRNPLSVIASSIETWGKPGQWNIHRLYVDLFVGLPRLIESYEARSSNVYSLRYEDMIENNSEMEKIHNYLGLTYNATMLGEMDDMSVKGTMGDKTGIEKYQSLSQMSVNKWKGVINSPIRKSWCVKYLKWLGSDRLSVMGYELDTLLNEIDLISNTYRSVPMDLLALGYGSLYGLFELPLLKSQFKGILRGKRPIAHR